MTDRLRFGVLSTARIGTEKVIPGIQGASNCEVTAIASRDVDTASAAADRLGIAHSFGSYEALLASDLVDAVYVPLPNHLHMEWTLAAARAGKHVLCEKPLALSAADAQSMVDGCAAAGVAFMEAFMYRLHPLWLEVMALIRSGEIGRVRTVSTVFGYFNDDPANIRNRIETGGGALMDIGCYAINLSRMIFDGEPRRVEAVMARHPEFGTDIVTTAVLEFDGGHAQFTVSTMAGHTQEVQIIGERGRIVIPIPFNVPPLDRSTIRLYRAGTPSVDHQTFTFAPCDPYTAQVEAFAEAVLTGIPVPTPPSDGVANMAVIESIVAAAGREAATP
jgi:predicted dehydrogenase